MEDWHIAQYYDDGRTEYRSQIGDYSVRIVQLINPLLPNKKDNWSYTVHSAKTGHMFSGNRFPWSAERAMNYVVIVLALNTFSKILKNNPEYYPKTWLLYNEDDLDRV